MNDEKFCKIAVILGFSIMVLVLVAFIILALFEEYEYCNCIKRCETCGKVVKE